MNPFEEMNPAETIALQAEERERQAKELAE